MYKRHTIKHTLIRVLFGENPVDVRASGHSRKKDNTVLFFKYIILLQSYRYIHSIINNIYKNITFYDYKIKRELFTLKHLYKTLDIAGEVLGERLNIDSKSRTGRRGRGLG